MRESSAGIFLGVFAEAVTMGSRVRLCVLWCAVKH